MAPIQVDQDDVVQVQLQAGPAGSRGSHTCQVCRRQAKVRAHPITNQHTAPSVLGLPPLPLPKPCAPPPRLPPPRPQRSLTGPAPPFSLPSGCLSWTIRVPFLPYLCVTFPGCPSLTDERELKPRGCGLELLEEVGKGHTYDLAVLWGWGQREVVRRQEGAAGVQDTHAQPTLPSSAPRWTRPGG